MNKDELIKLMHSSGFDWIVDIAYNDGIEQVATKINEKGALWWHHLEAEGPRFDYIFKGKIKEVLTSSSDSQ